MTTKQQNEFIQSLNGELTPEDAARLLEMGSEGDTGAQPEPSGAPNAAGAAPASTASNEPAASTTAAGEGKDGAVKPQPDGVKPDGAATTTPAEPDPSKTVILAADGVHTIEYQKLVDARKDAQTARQEADAAKQELAALKAEAAHRAQAGEAPTAKDTQVATATAAIDKGVDPAIFGDFSDEAIAKGIATLFATAEASIEAKVKAQVEARLAPIQQEAAKSATDAHFTAIYAKHPDLDSLVQSKELDAWIKAQPSFVQAPMRDVIQQGTSQQVIELFDRFKQATGTNAANATQLSGDAVKAAAAAAIAKAAEPPVPNSLTDLAGGRPGALATRDEQWAQMDGQALIGAMADATPEQIERFLNRRV